MKNLILFQPSLCLEKGMIEKMEETEKKVLMEELEKTLVLLKDAEKRMKEVIENATKKNSQ